MAEHVAVYLQRIWLWRIPFIRRSTGFLYSLKLDDKKIANVECIINSKRNDKHCIGWGKRLNSKEVCLSITIDATTSHTVVSYKSLANSKINSFGHAHVLLIGICVCLIDILMNIPRWYLCISICTAWGIK